MGGGLCADTCPGCMPIPPSNAFLDSGDRCIHEDAAYGPVREVEVEHCSGFDPGGLLGWVVRQQTVPFRHCTAQCQPPQITARSHFAGARPRSNRRGPARVARPGTPPRGRAPRRASAAAAGWPRPGTGRGGRGRADRRATAVFCAWGSSAGLTLAWNRPERRLAPREGGSRYFSRQV